MESWTAKSVEHAVNRCENCPPNTETVSHRKCAQSAHETDRISVAATRHRYSKHIVLCIYTKTAIVPRARRVYIYIYTIQLYTNNKCNLLFNSELHFRVWRELACCHLDMQSASPAVQFIESESDRKRTVGSAQKKRKEKKTPTPPPPERL